MRRTSASGATVDGRFKETPAPATKVTASDLNMLWDELCNVVTNPAGGNMALNPGDNGQLLAAILAIVGRATAPDGETLVLGNWIIKTGSNRSAVASEVIATVNYVTPFPAGTTMTILLTKANPTGSSFNNLWVELVDSSVSTAGFNAKYQADDTVNMGAAGFDWFAIGRTA